METNHLSEPERQLYRRIDEILFFIWDPMGLSKRAVARHEYEAYLPQVFGRVMRDCDHEELVRYLSKMESEQMGLGRNPNMETRTSLVADLLLELKQELFLFSVHGEEAFEDIGGASELAIREGG